MTLEIDAVSTPLGADARNIVVPRLEAVLSAPALSAGSAAIDGLRTTWVTSFSELHCSIHAADSFGSRQLFFKDAEANLLGVIILSGADRARWLQQLGTG